MKETRITSLCGLPTLLCVVVCTMVVFERADACVHDCGECGEWSESLQECVPYPRSLCVEDSDCGTCGECAGPAPCQCVADEDACTGECDECDTSGGDEFNCWDDQAQCNLLSTKVCETCRDGICEDDDDKCLVCGDCFEGHCYGNDEKCDGCEKCYYRNCYDYDANCSASEVCIDANCVPAGFCQQLDTCYTPELMHHCSERDGTSQEECESSFVGLWPAEGLTDWSCSDGSKCMTYGEDDGQPYCVRIDSCRWDAVNGFCENDQCEPLHDAPEYCKDKDNWE